MNEKEISEIRRRFRPDKSNINCVHGCYVNDNREIVSVFHQSIGLMPQEESEKLLSILKRTLSGTPGKNLIEISFATRQVVEGEEHRLLMALRDSGLRDEEAIQTFFQRVIQSLQLDSHYLILLAYDTYDVPYRSRDGEKQEDASSEVYSYLLCSICPVKTTRPALGYYINENAFHNLQIDWIVAPPELGFLFPAFDDRCANLYNALYYSHNIAENHQEFVDAVFHSEIPMPAAVQKETFESILTDTLADECCLEVVQTVQASMREMMEEHKTGGEEEPLVVSRNTVKRVLQSSGVSESHVAAFEEKYDEGFGADTSLAPCNIVETKKLELCTPDVTIRVNPERSDLVETRIINGVKYILIRADGGVEVNGIQIQISE